MSGRADSNPQAGQGRPLPRKEADLFRNVVKFYESKSYKKGLKNADVILKRFPNHGETLCMKGLIVNAMASSRVVEADGRGEGDKKKEAVDLIKRGLMMDMRSHVCWHVYGLLHRSCQDYSEAIKAYKQALRIDPENLQILRDLGLLQVQMRDLAGFRETRLAILTLRPNSKVHWLTYALAVHVGGDPAGAVDVIDSYTDTLDEDTAPEFQRNFESSELVMYKNRAMGEAAGDDEAGLRGALENLDRIEPVAVDRTGWLLARVDYQLRLRMYDEAAGSCLMLFERGITEDHRIHGAYMCALLRSDAETVAAVSRMKGTGTLATLAPLDDGQRTTLLGAYERPPACLSRSPAVRRIVLTLLDPSGPAFRAALDGYARRQLGRGVPSLGSDLSSLYLDEVRGDGTSRYVLATDPADVRAHGVHRLLAGLVDSYVSSLEGGGSFPRGSGGGEGGEEEEEEEAGPGALLWSWYLRAVLHEQAGEYAEGLSLIDRCIDHTPTAVDFYELKARLLEAGGDVGRAADVVDAGRDLDHQDRYINNLATRLLMRAGREDDARDRIAMFTRHEGDPERNLYDMQCVWYELELADCCRRKGDLGRGLRKYMAVIKHYQDFHDDQFDFHAYCIRKVTLRSYCDLLRFEDDIWGLPLYGRAAEAVIGIHLHLLDNPVVDDREVEPDYSNMTPAERKKAKNIARKKKKKLEQQRKESAEDARAKDGKNGNSNKKKAKPHVIDEDPEGKELLKLDHLDEARKYATILARHAPRRVSSWAWQYDVSIRRGKYLMALQALFKMRGISPTSHELFSRTVDFAQKLASRPAEQKCSEAAEGVISSEFPDLMSGESLPDFVASAARDVKSDPLSSLPMRTAVAKALVSTGAGSKADAAALILDSKLNTRGVDMETCRAALDFMGTLGSDNKNAMAALVKARFPFSK